MHEVRLEGCTATPLGSYLKSLAILRLVSEQADAHARGYWGGDVFVLHSSLDEEALLDFFLKTYAPTPILAPWNGGSGFYPKDNKEGIAAIESTADARFEKYRKAISTCKGFAEVQQGKCADEDERRTRILLRCRAELDDSAVEWLDAAVGVAADGSRSFAPILGTGGNEGRLDYTNNFMARIAALLIAPDRKVPVRDLLANCLFGRPTNGLQNLAAGQYDPGRAGGANQGPGVAHETPVNPWDLVFTLEGAVAWAGGLYRRQGVSYRSILCSPFTVQPTVVGYGSASGKDDARAEVWTPLWTRPARYAELRVLLREGHASVDGRPVRNGIEFAEAACSLGVDRRIDRFIRYNLLKRRGDSYVAVPTGSFLPGYRTEADLIRQMRGVLDRYGWLWAKQDGARRQIEAAMLNVLAGRDGATIRDVMTALGRVLRRASVAVNSALPSQQFPAEPWLAACGFSDTPEVRIAAALASLFTREVGSMADHLSRADNRFAWEGSSFAGRLLSVLQRRLQIGFAAETEVNPVRATCELHPGDASLFIEGSVNDELIEDLLFAFVTLEWGSRPELTVEGTRPEVLPVYALLKTLFLPARVDVNGEEKRLAADLRVLSFLRAGDISSAAAVAVHRLRVAGLRPINVEYAGGIDADRLAGSLLIPVRPRGVLRAGILHDLKVESYA